MANADLVTNTALALWAAAVVALCISPASGSEIRAAAVDDFAAIQRNERTERYLRDLDSAAERTLRVMDTETGLIRVPGLMDPRDFDWSIASLDRSERKRSITPAYSTYYRLSRGSAAAIGLLAEAYALPLSRFHRDPRLLGAVRKGLAAFARHQDPSGEWVFCPIRFSTVYGSHEMAWRLEPLLRAYVSVKADLEPEERNHCERMLRQAADFLLRTPCTDHCNRGVVWSGVMALCHAMIGKPEYQAAARRNWALVAPEVFAQDGQVLEGAGPDLGYSTVSLRYAFLYRVMSGDASADGTLMRSLRWAMRLYDPNGLPFTGMSTRNDTADVGRLEAYLPALEYYASHEPLFDRLAGDYLRCLESSAPGFSKVHGGTHALRAALLHGARPDASGAAVPDYFEVYQAQQSAYVAVQRGYRTVINLRSPQPLKGLQMWTYGREKPVIRPAQGLASGHKAGGYSSAAVDVSEGDYRTWRSGLQALAVDRGGHYEFYVFSPVSTVLIYAASDLPAAGLEGLPRRTRWVLSKVQVPQPSVEAGRVRIAGQESALSYGGAPPLLHDEGEARVIEFAVDSSFELYAFSGGPFRLETVCEPAEGIIAFGFADPTGTYLVLANPSRSAWKGRVHLIRPKSRTLALELGDRQVQVIALRAGN